MNVRELSNSLALSRAVLQMHGVDLQLVNPPEEPDTTVAYLIFNRVALERTSNPESSNIRELLVPFQEFPVSPAGVDTDQRPEYQAVVR